MPHLIGSVTALIEEKKIKDLKNAVQSKKKSDETRDKKKFSEGGDMSNDVVF